MSCSTFRYHRRPGRRLNPNSQHRSDVGDGGVLAVAVMTCRGSKQEDFALFRPDGHLGRRTALMVGDLTYRNEGIPRGEDDALLKEGILKMSSKRLGLTCVVDGAGRLQGIITDGDWRDD